MKILWSYCIAKKYINHETSSETYRIHYYRGKTTHKFFLFQKISMDYIIFLIGVHNTGDDKQTGSSFIVNKLYNLFCRTYISFWVKISTRPNNHTKLDFRGRTADNR